MDAYAAGQRHFGENYTNELAKKSKDPRILEHCSNICWHYIGSIGKRSSPLKALSKCNNIFAVQTVDSVTAADNLNKLWSSRTAPLRIMIQVNTSGEAQKSGIKPNEVIETWQHVVDQYKHLDLLGLMTIGSYNESTSKETNADFTSLVQCRTHLSDALRLDTRRVELSMGMSHDFETAIAMGSTSVRIGSEIFGERPVKAKKIG